MATMSSKLSGFSLRSASRMPADFELEHAGCVSARASSS